MVEGGNFREKKSDLSNESRKKGDRVWSGTLKKKVGLEPQSGRKTLAEKRV